MVPLFSPIRQNEPLFNLFLEKFEQVLKSGNYILGDTVSQFETSLAGLLGYKKAVGCGSGTDALILSLKALNLGSDAEVITPAFSFIASATTIAWSGYTPVIVDIDPSTCNLSLDAVEKALTPRTRAVVAVDLYGRQAPIRELRKLCDAHGLYLIEDGAQSIGVPNQGAHIYTTSFYPTKNVGALGDAGAVLSDDEQLACHIQQLAQHGALKRDEYIRVGTNARLDALQAALLEIKLSHLEEWSQKRRQIAHTYTARLSHLAQQGHFSLPAPPEQASSHVWSLYTLQIKESRNSVAEKLRELGIGCGIYYPKALNRQVACDQYKHLPCPHAEKMADHCLSLPLFPELTDSEIEQVIVSVEQVFS